MNQKVKINTTQKNCQANKYTQKKIHLNNQYINIHNILIAQHTKLAEHLHLLQILMLLISWQDLDFLNDS